MMLLSICIKMNFVELQQVKTTLEHLQLRSVCDPMAEATLAGIDS
jgi:hypothetical protein